jgi:Tol biopolymer transport system component
VLNVVIGLFALAQSVSYPVVLERPKADGESMQIVALDGALNPRPLFDGQYPSSSNNLKHVAFAVTKWMPDEQVVPGLWTQLFVRKSTKSPEHAVPLATFKGPVTLTMPMFSPDDRKICYEVTPQRPTISDKQRGIYVVSTKGGQSQLIYTPRTQPASNCWPSWTNSGKGVVLVDGPEIVWVDVATKAITRGPSSLLLGEQSTKSRVFMLRASPTNAKLFAFTTRPALGSAFEAAHSMVYVGRVGETMRAVSGAGSSWHPRWTPDGKALLFYRVSPGHNQPDLVAFDVATKSESTIFRA